MKKSTYTRTALASLLTLCSFSGGFAADLPSEGMREIKKQESTKTSGKPEFTNKKLKEKMDRICNAVPRKKAEEAKQAAEQKKKDEMKLAAEKKKKEEEMRLASEKIKNDKAKDSKASAKNGKDLKNDPKTEKAVNAKDSKASAKNGKDLKNDSKTEKAVNAKDSKPGKDKASKAKDSKTETKNIKPVTNKNIEDKSKSKAIEARKSGATDLSLEAKSGLRITFGGVVDAQGYGKAGPSGDEYKRYNLMAGAPKDYTNYYNVDADKIKGANPIFPQGIGNVRDYSDDFGTVADAILHLRAENKNEDLGLLYGADVQFHVPVTEGKGASQGVYAARGRGAHIFVNSEYGDVKLGYQFGPEALMRLDATRIATADGGANSDWFRKVNLEGSAASFPFYVTPRLWTESFSSESEKLSFRMAGKYNKGVMTTLPFRVAYYSPNYMGARFGISYSPRYESSLFSVSDNIGAAQQTTNITLNDFTEDSLKAVVTLANLDTDNIASDSTKRSDAIAKIRKSLTDGGLNASQADAIITAISTENGISNVAGIINRKLASLKGTSTGKEKLRHVGPDYEHIISAGVSYDYDFDEYKLKVKASAVGEWGQAKKSNDAKHVYDEYVEYENLMGANFGVSADYKIDQDQSAKFAASFAYLGKSGQPKGIKTLDGSQYGPLNDQNRVEGLKQFNGNTMYWTAGAGYQHENIYTSLTYFGSKMNDGDMLHDIALGVQYDLSPACSKSKFVPYAALHYFVTKEIGNNDFTVKGKTTVAPPNKGALLLTGVKFSF